MKNCWFMVFAVMLVGLLLVTPYVAAIDSGDGESTWSSITKFAKTTSENSKYINKLTEYFPEDVLAATIKNVDDYDDIAKGTKVVMGSYLKGLDDFHKALPEVERLRLIKKIGKYDELIKQKEWVKHIGSEPLKRGLPKRKLANPEDAFIQGFKAGGGEDDLLSHIGGSTKTRFVPTTTIPERAKAFAIKEFSEGYVFDINPRALNGVDVEKSLKPLKDSGKIDEDTWKNIIQYENEIAFIDDISPQDIIGYQKVDHLGNPLGDFVPNKNYAGGD